MADTSKLNSEMEHRRPFNPWPGLVGQLSRANQWISNQVPSFGYDSKADQFSEDYDPFYSQDVSNLSKATGLIGGLIDPTAKAIPGTAGAIRVWHGSPHQFDKFDISKLGTGEGSNSFGKGLYFAEEPKVARRYWEMFNPQGKAYLEGKEIPYLYTFEPYNSPEELKRVIKDYEYRYNDEVEKWVNPAMRASAERTRGKIFDLVNQIDQGKVTVDSGGGFYGVDLKWPDKAKEVSSPMNVSDFLALDKPISQQQELVNKIPEFDTEFVKRHISEDPSGDEFTRALKVLTYDARKDPIGYMKNAGIPGYSYLDQFSRDVGKGTRNYVVFDDNIPHIVSRNGIPFEKLIGK